MPKYKLLRSIFSVNQLRHHAMPDFNFMLLNVYSKNWIFVFRYAKSLKNSHFEPKINNF
eukprot:02640.XXX_91640_91816_1 [CDS] Oithona nana genome sequencing.